MPVHPSIMVAVMKGAGTPTRADFHEAISTRSDRWFAACLKITRNRDLAEDAVQDALLSAWNKREQFDGQARLDTWIHRIAVNAALQLLRKNRPGIFEPLEEEPADMATSPEGAALNRELDRELSVALTQLSETERVCFVLKHLEQWRLREISDELDIGISTVKQALFRGVRKLRGSVTSLKGTPT
jgi:RNA polymerase sigma-70 factor (ECF subfamily)